MPLTLEQMRPVSVPGVEPWGGTAEDCVHGYGAGMCPFDGCSNRGEASELRFLILAPMKELAPPRAEPPRAAPSRRGNRRVVDPPPPKLVAKAPREPRMALCLYQREPFLVADDETAWRWLRVQ